MIEVLIKISRGHKTMKFAHLRSIPNDPEVESIFVAIEEGETADRYTFETICEARAFFKRCLEALERE